MSVKKCFAIWSHNFYFSYL